MWRLGTALLAHDPTVAAGVGARLRVEQVHSILADPDAVRVDKVEAVAACDNPIQASQGFVTNKKSIKSVQASLASSRMRATERLDG